VHRLLESAQLVPVLVYGLKEIGQQAKMIGVMRVTVGNLRRPASNLDCVIQSTRVLRSPVHFLKVLGQPVRRGKAQGMALGYQIKGPPADSYRLSEGIHVRGQPIPCMESFSKVYESIRMQRMTGAERADCPASIPDRHLDLIKVMRAQPQFAGSYGEVKGTCCV
jgi:hypothetical protein